MITSKKEKRKKKKWVEKKEGDTRPKTVKIANKIVNKNARQEKQRTPKPRRRSEAVIIKPTNGKTCADILNDIQNRVNPKMAEQKLDPSIKPEV